MRIGVAGANSSVGRNLLAHVAEASDSSVVAGVRSERAAESLPVSPRITPRVISYDDIGDLAKAFGGTSSVAHLAGILIESRTSTYEHANVGTTAAVVEACRAGAVPQIVLVSVLGADPGSPNRYLRSKGEAEWLVAESGIRSVIIRTPILLGPGTAGTRGLLRTAAQPKARVLAGGTHTVRPLDLDDLSQAILRVCRTPAEGVVTHELVGPEPITYRDLVTRVGERLGGDVSVAATPVWAAKLGAAITHRVTGRGVSPTVIDVITSSESVERNADADLGISLTPLSATLDKITAEKAPAA